MKKASIFKDRTEIEIPLAIAPFDSEQARYYQEQTANILGMPVDGSFDLSEDVKIVFKLIPPGEFMMGSEKRDNEKPIHKVTISKPFYVSIYTVTEAQYKALMNKDLSRSKIKDMPVTHVHWSDADDFCTKLSNKTGKKVALPSEAQWEYACRAGSQASFCFGDDISRICEYGWFLKNSEWVNPVGQKNPNAWGLYDMHGNVYEWCQDWWHDNYKLAPTDGCAWTWIFRGEKTSRVLRGGCCRYPTVDCRSALRIKEMECFCSIEHNSICFHQLTGFRIILI